MVELYGSSTVLRDFTIAHQDQYYLIFVMGQFDAKRSLGRGGSAILARMNPYAYEHQLGLWTLYDK